MLGLMALLHLEFNFMNIFVGLMIIGVATDYAIYMLQRYTENPATFRDAAHETGKAIIMAALILGTTLATLGVIVQSDAVNYILDLFKDFK